MRNGGSTLRILLVATGVVAYGYWATGQTPFGVSDYVAVGIPIALAVAAVLIKPSRSAPRRSESFGRLGSAWLASSSPAAFRRLAVDRLEPVRCPSSGTQAVT